MVNLSLLLAMEITSFTLRLHGDKSHLELVRNFFVDFGKIIFIFQSGLDFVWAQDPKEYAVRESASRIKVR